MIVAIFPKMVLGNDSLIVENISGKYQGKFTNTNSNLWGDYLDVKKLKGNVISLKFLYDSSEIKLTAVTKLDEHVICLFLSEKYANSYYISGDGNLLVHEGLHGWINPKTTEIYLQFNFTGYNQHPIRVSFLGCLK